MESDDADVAILKSEYFLCCTFCVLKLILYSHSKSE